MAPSATSCCCRGACPCGAAWGGCGGAPAVGTTGGAFLPELYGVQRGAEDAMYPNLQENGQWATGARDSLRAYSHAGVTPSRFMTWFQASALCNAAGKRLMTRREWFAATDGLSAVDPTTAINGNTPGETRCNTGGSAARVTGRGVGCATRSPIGVPQRRASALRSLCAKPRCTT